MQLHLVAIHMLEIVRIVWCFVVFCTIPMTTRLGNWPKKMLSFTELLTPHLRANTLRSLRVMENLADIFIKASA